MKRSLVEGVIVGASIGAVLGAVYAWNPHNIPSAPEIAVKLKKPYVWMIVGTYYVLGFAILQQFFQPKAFEQWMTVAVGSVLWDTF